MRFLRQLALVGVLVPVVTLLIGCDRADPASDVRADDSAAAAAPSEPRAGLDVTDVSILFPKRLGVGATSPKITAEERNSVDGSDILPASVFDDILAHAEAAQALSAETAAAKKRSNWRVQAFRVTPCNPPDDLAGAGFAGEIPQDRCVVQLRVILQPLASGESTTRVVDAAIHLLYELGTGLTSPEAAAIADELAALKAATPVVTDGAPLGVHPGLRAQLFNAADARPFEAKVKAFLLRHASAERLRRATALIGNQQADLWFFYGGDVRQADGAFRWSAFKLANNGGQATTQVLRLSTQGGTSMTPAASPLSGFSADGFANVFPRTEAALQAMAAVDDPRRVTSENTDCGSCHITSQGSARLGAEQIASVERYRPAAGVTGYPLNPPYALDGALQRELRNVRNFGYFINRPTVSLRVVNETAEAVRLFNTVVRPARNVGLDCTDADADGTVTACILGQGVGCTGTCKAPSNIATIAAGSAQLKADLFAIPGCFPLVDGGVLASTPTSKSVTLSETASACVRKVFPERVDTALLRIDCGERCIVTTKSADASVTLAAADARKVYSTAQAVTASDGRLRLTTPAPASVSLDCGFGLDASLSLAFDCKAAVTP
jgi:hypothetical protein